MKKTVWILFIVLLSGAGFAKEVLMDKSYYSWVDKLNLRDKPSLTSKVVYQLPEGEDVVFLGKKTKEEITIQLRGTNYTAPWVLVQAKNGTQGWIFAGGLKKKNALEVTADKTKLFADPDLNGLVLIGCKKGEIVTYKDYQTDIKDSFQIGGKTVKDVWVLVETSQGYRGWIPAPYLKNVLNGLPDAPEAEKNKVSSANDLWNAVQGAESGDVITVASGSYYISQTLTIESKDNLTIAGEGEVNIYIKDENADVMNIYECGTIVLKNLHLKHYNPPQDLNCTGNVIVGYNSDSLKLENCVIDGSGYWGLWLSGFNSVELKDTKFLNHVDSSLMLDSIKVLFIDGCEFKNNGGGINIDVSEKYRINKCKYYDKSDIEINGSVYTKKEFENGINFDNSEGDYEEYGD
ncbi:MAG: SH3 domain-containing protein [Brevinematales bacterium]|nr:SH3 domain-containing protein [Brevinematales bacterium]